jgi:metallophosphoesterase superfamily enzyme
LSFALTFRCCVFFGQNVLVLPTFGSVTGGEIMATQPDDRIFVSFRETFVELPTTSIR